MGEMTKQEIAKELLDPYFKDPSLCSMGLHDCQYNGPDGKHCAFAMACKPDDRKHLNEGEGAIYQISKFGFDILKNKYQHIKDGDFWNRVQSVHDRLAHGIHAEAQYNYLQVVGSLAPIKGGSK